MIVDDDVNVRSQRTVFLSDVYSPLGGNDRIAAVSARSRRWLVLRTGLAKGASLNGGKFSVAHGININIGMMVDSKL